jgi:hypothetical protein
VKAIASALLDLPPLPRLMIEIKSAEKLVGPNGIKEPAATAKLRVAA